MSRPRVTCAVLLFGARYAACWIGPVNFSSIDQVGKREKHRCVQPRFRRNSRTRRGEIGPSGGHPKDPAVLQSEIDVLHSRGALGPTDEAYDFERDVA